ncbi:MAG TPA: YihY/virulence factor BrkB family protein [Gemmatimonadota bacterium]
MAIRRVQEMVPEERGPLTLLELWRIFKETFVEWDQDGVSRLAAALAYYTIFSLAPLLVLLVAAGGLVFGEDATKSRIVSQVANLFGPRGAEIIASVIDEASRPGSGLIATGAGLVVLFIGATGAFAQLQGGLNAVWGVAPRPRGALRAILRTRALSFLMVLASGVLLLASVVLGAATEAFGDFLTERLPGLFFDPGVLGSFLTLVLMIVLFAAIYEILPDVELTWRHVWLGAVTTAVLFTLGKHLIGIYLARGTVGSAYGAAGTLAVLLIWIYFSAQVFYFGAELTQVYSRHRGWPIRPADHATRVVRLRIEAESDTEASRIAAALLEKVKERPGQIVIEGKGATPGPDVEPAPARVERVSFRRRLPARRIQREGRGAGGALATKGGHDVVRPRGDVDDPADEWSFGAAPDAWAERFAGLVAGLVVGVVTGVALIARAARLGSAARPGPRELPKPREAGEDPSASGLRAPPEHHPEQRA